MRIAPISIYDVPAQQAWLEDMAARGRFLSAYWSGIFALAWFTKGEPKAVRYRLEPMAVKAEYPDAAQREVYRSLGWEYVTTAGKTMYVWRCDDPAAPELHTEPETEARAYDRLRRALRRVNILALLVSLALLVLLAALPLLSGPDYFRQQVESWRPAAITAAVGFAFFFLLWQTFRQAWALRRFLRTLRAGVSVEHRGPYRFSRALSCVMAVSYICFLAAQIADIAQPNSWTPQPLDSFAEPVPCVALLEPEDMRAIRWKNWLTAEQWWTFEDGRYSQEVLEAAEMEEYPFSEGRYYRLRLPWHAPRLVDSILAGYRDQGWAVTMLEAPDLDGCWLTDTGDGWQLLTLRLGPQVWDISARNCGDLRDRVAEYAAVLAEFQ